MSLRSLRLNDRYRSDRDDVVASFYVPAFEVATSYSRAVGYFTSTSLALFARGIESFAARGGKMRLIASPHLNEEDVLDIERGYDVREVIARAADRALEIEERSTVLDGLSLVGRLIASGRLDIKLAFVQSDGRFGIYHEKIGLFRDALGDLVGFTGSSNETFGGLMANFESVQVFKGWALEDGTRALRLEADFEELWANQTPKLTVEDFPEVARDRLIKLGEERHGKPLAGTDDALAPPFAADDRSMHLAIPEWLDPRNYQKSAVEAWLRNRGRGMLKMATGTGKTKTSMIAATQLASVLSQREEPLVLLIVAPQKHLVDQWLSEVEGFGVRPIPIYESSQHWGSLVEEQLAEVRLGQRSIVAMVATNASFAGQTFQSILARIAQPMLIIADEAHNLGSSAYRSQLPPNATYRLALSATPERWFDDDGTDALIDYFGPIVFELEMREAIEMGALCRYEYHPRLVELNHAETELYVDLTGQIAKRLAAGDSLSDDDINSPIGRLLRDRSGILGHAAGKLAAVEIDLRNHATDWFQLAYCAEGSRPAETGEPRGPNQLREVLNLLGNELHLSTHAYISETSRPERKVLLRRFGTGNDLRVLVSMRCLDEGVDIPDARIGYLLASSSNPRQFIQRRGRLLRRAAGKDRAVIYDYLAVPPESAPLNWDIERKLLAREFERANEFGKMSENFEATLETLRPLKQRYQLMDL
jgi:superfamily II DNA or RNA helicase